MNSIQAPATSRCLSETYDDLKHADQTADCRIIWKNLTWPSSLISWFRGRCLFWCFEWKMIQWNRSKNTYSVSMQTHCTASCFVSGLIKSSYEYCSSKGSSRYIFIKHLNKSRPLLCASVLYRLVYWQTSSTGPQTEEYLWYFMQYYFCYNSIDLVEEHNTPYGT